MRNVTLSVVLLGVLLSGFVAGSWYSQRETLGAIGFGPPKIRYYVDPMHPSYKSDKPGLAPDCGMPLEPVYEDGIQLRDAEESASSARSGRVSINPGKQQLAGVRVISVEKTEATGQLRLYGRVAADETRLYRIDVGINGFVRELSAVTTGARVRKGQWLASLAAPEARSPIQGYLASVEVLERTNRSGEDAVSTQAAASSLQLMTDRLLTIGVPRTQIDEISRTREVPATIDVTAPADGSLVARSVTVGQKVERGDELFRIADLSRVWVLAEVFGADARYVVPGAAAVVSIPGRSAAFTAEVSRDVPTEFDRDSQSLKARLLVDNRWLLLRPDMSVDVDLTVALPPAIALPADAIIDSGLRRTVLVEQRPGVFEPREVETGWHFGGRVEILNGLTAGERVVVAGSFVVDAERRIRTSTNDDRLRP